MPLTGYPMFNFFFDPAVHFLLLLLLFPVVGESILQLWHLLTHHSLKT